MDPRPPWTKRRHRDELELLVDLGDPLLKAALDGIRDLFCLRGGNLPDDDKYISGNLAITPHKWRFIKAKLIERGQISISQGKIECPLALESYLEAASLMEQRRQAGIRSGQARKVQSDGVMLRKEGVADRVGATHFGPRINKDNRLDQANVQSLLKQQRERRTKKSSWDTVSEALQQSSAPAVARTLMKRAKERR